jgi:hypothetical protein
MSPNKLNRCRSGGAPQTHTQKGKDSNGNVYVDVYKIPYTPDRPLAIDFSKSVEALTLENEHLNGIIQALNLKVKMTGDLEKELIQLRQAI